MLSAAAETIILGIPYEPDTPFATAVAIPDSEIDIFVSFAAQSLLSA
jgi:hypothetical protein